MFQEVVSDFSYFVDDAVEYVPAVSAERDHCGYFFGSKSC